MSEQTNEQAPEQPTTAPAAPPAQESAPQAPPAEPKPTETVDYWKQMARQNEERAKANAAKAKQYDAFEESQKTEQQKLSERAESASRELEAARSEVTRLRIAARHGLSEDDFDLLGSGSEEDIEKRAQKLAAYKQAATPAAVTAAKRPSENLRPGATPTTEATSDDAYPSEWLPTTTRPGNSGA